MKKEILDIISKNSRYSLEDLAAMIGTDEETVAREIKEMEDNKIICGYPALINWDNTSHEKVTALIEVNVTPQRDMGFNKVAERIYKFEEVESVYLMSGGFDLTVIIQGKSMKEVARFVSEKLSTLEYVNSTATYFVLKKYKEQRRYTKGFFALIGFKKKEFLYDRDSRVAGQSKWNYFNLFNLAIEGITSFSNFPLRLSSFLGIIVAAFGFIYIVFLVLKTLIFGEPVRGYPTLLSVIIFLGGIQLLSLGVIGEYLGRIFDEVKNRPLYFVEKYSGDEE